MARRAGGPRASCGLSIGRGVASLTFVMMMRGRGRSFLVWVGRSGRGGRAVARVPGEFHSIFRGRWSCAVRRVRVANGPREESGGLKTGFALKAPIRTEGGVVFPTWIWANPSANSYLRTLQAECLFPDGYNATNGFYAARVRVGSINLLSFT